MNELIRQLDTAIAALYGLEIKTTRNNLDRLLGSIQVLDTVREKMNDMLNQHTERGPDDGADN